MTQLVPDGAEGRQGRHRTAHVDEQVPVVDSESLALLYTQIGFPTQGKNAVGQFETADALTAGARIHHALFHQEDFTRRLAQAFTK